MSYIGNVPTTAAFPFDQFSGNGTTTAFTLTYAPASPTSIIVSISGVVQNPNLYSVSGNTLTFAPAPPTGTNNIAVLYLGLPVIGVSNPGNTAFFSVTDITATAGQVTFTPSGAYTPGFVTVFRNGARLGNADYTATNGVTVVLNNPCVAGDIVTIETFILSSLVNALPLTGGTVTGTTTFNSGVTFGSAPTFGTSTLALPPGSAPSYTCRAWVNFNGTGTVAIRASGNVSSITDNATGNYTVNFTTAMPDANYSLVVAAGDTSTAAIVVPFFGNSSTLLSSSARFRVRYQTGSTTLDSDADIVCVSIFC